MPRPLTPPTPGSESNRRIVKVNVRTTYDNWLAFRAACLREGYPVSHAIGVIASNCRREKGSLKRLLKSPPIIR